MTVIVIQFGLKTSCDDFTMHVKTIKQSCTYFRSLRLRIHWGNPLNCYFGIHVVKESYLQFRNILTVIFILS